jgi:hypothetical protein
VSFLTQSQTNKGYRRILGNQYRAVGDHVIRITYSSVELVLGENVSYDSISISQD